MYRVIPGGDYAFKCPLISFNRAFAELYPADDSVYLYSFERRLSRSGVQPVGSLVDMHGEDIEMVFGVPFRVNQTGIDAERTLSANMMKFWTNFAKTG